MPPLRFAPAAVLMLLTTPALAQGLPRRPVPIQAAPAPTLHITGSGEYVVRRELGPRELPAPKPDADTVKLVEDPRIIRQTRQIEARLCRSFGFLFTMDNLPPGGMDVTITSVHPGILHPSGRVSTGVTYDTTINPGPPGLVGFSFDEPWELVPGTWTFTVRDGDRLLAEQSYEVLASPEGAQTERQDCSAVTS